MILALLLLSLASSTTGAYLALNEGSASYVTPSTGCAFYDHANIGTGQWYTDFVIDSRSFHYQLDGDGFRNFRTTSENWQDTFYGASTDSDKTTVSAGPAVANAAECQARCDAAGDQCVGIALHFGNSYCSLLAQCRAAVPLENNAASYMKLNFTNYNVYGVQVGATCTGSILSYGSHLNNFETGIVRIPPTPMQCEAHCKTVGAASHFVMDRNMACVCYDGCTPDTSTTDAPWSTVYTIDNSTPSPTTSPTPDTGITTTTTTTTTTTISGNAPVNSKNNTAGKVVGGLLGTLLLVGGIGWLVYTYRLTERINYL